MKVYKCPKCHCKIPENMVTEAFGKTYGQCWNCGYHGELDVYDK